MVAAIISDEAHSNTNQMIDIQSFYRSPSLNRQWTKQSFLLEQFYWKRLLSIKSHD